jgi:hypothetical protein
MVIIIRTLAWCVTVMAVIVLIIGVSVNVVNPDNDTVEDILGFRKI